VSTPERSILDLMQAQGRRTPRILLRTLEGDEKVGAAKSRQRYQLIDKIAQGGVGVVWRARDVDLGRHAAIKVLRGAYGQSPDTIERFVEEAQIGGQLQHPGIVPVYGLGVLEDYRPYFAMKLIKGRTLADLLEERKDPAQDQRRMLSVFEHVCNAVAYAHARGVIHRDLKPRNIMLGAFGEVQVVDWGFAKVLAQGGVADERHAPGRPEKPQVTVIATVRTDSEGSSDSVEGQMMGTVAYMPPEQALGMIDELDERSDVFSLGAILCEILTGEPPYTPDRGDPYEQATTALLDPAKRALDECGADSELVALAKHCLAPLRKGRPRNAQAVARTMTDYLTSVEERAHRAELAAIAARSEAAETRERAERARLDGLAGRRARRQTVALAVALLLLVVGAGGTFLWMRHDRVTRERKALAAIDEALNEARFCEGRAEWVGAIAAAQRAKDLAHASDVDASTKSRAQAQLLRYQEEKERAEEDAVMLARIDGLRSRWSNGDNHRQTDRDYAQAYKDYGYAIDQGDPAEIGAQLHRRRIAAELAAALDDWSLLRRAANALKGSDWKRLLDVARAADPDEIRNKVRNATATRDLQALRTLGATEDLPARTLLLLGHGMTVAGDPQQGIVVLRRAVLQFPRDPWVHARLAYAFDQVKSRRASVRYYSAAVALRPENAQMNLQLGDSLILARQTDQAIPVYRRAIEYGPTIVRAYIGLGLALYDQKDYRGTVKVCEDAIKNAPEHTLPYYLLGTAYTMLKEYQKAEEALKKAAELGPNYAMVHREMGDLYFRMRRHEDAIDAYDKALKLKPKDFTGWYRKGSSHQTLKEYGKSLEAFHNARKLFPDHPDVNLMVARIHWEQRQWEKALPWLERAHRLGTKAGNWRYPTARFIEQAKAWQTIEPRLPALIKGDEKPRDATEQRRVAELCYEVKDYAAATRFWKDLFKQHPVAEVTAARYDAACAAARADTPQTRALAKGWLERNLEELRAMPKAKIKQRLNHWKRDGDLVGVRDQLDMLPDEERPAWKQFWGEVDALLAEQN
jgi:serine/threonine-protein kinase